MSISSDDIYHIFLSQPKIPLDIAHGYTPVESSQFWCSHWRQTAKLTPWHPMILNLNNFDRDFTLAFSIWDLPLVRLFFFSFFPISSKGGYIHLLQLDTESALWPRAEQLYTIIIVVMGYENGKTMENSLSNEMGHGYAMGIIGFRIPSEKHAAPELCDKLDAAEGPPGSCAIFHSWGLFGSLPFVQRQYCMAWQNQEHDIRWY